jgi:hypothetical protein
MTPDLVALHLGALHPAEKVLTLVLAFGPFLVLGAVIAFRRRDEDEEPDGTEDQHEGQHEVQHEATV